MGTIKYSWFLKVLLEKWYSANQEASNVDKIKKNIKKKIFWVSQKKCPLVIREQKEYDN